MARAKIKVNYPGLMKVADSPEMHQAVEGAGDEVAAQVARGGYTAEAGAKESGPQLRAEVEMKSDPAVARVVVKHPAALAMQARHGMLTRAATAAGLKVKPPRG